MYFQALVPYMCAKHREVSVARVPLATSGKQVFVKTTEVLYKPNITSREAKLTLCAPKQASHEAKQAPREPKQALREPIQRLCGLQSPQFLLLIQLHAKLK